MAEMLHKLCGGNELLWKVYLAGAPADSKANPQIDVRLHFDV